MDEETDLQRLPMITQQGLAKAKMQILIFFPTTPGPLGSLLAT